jgi:hypothetical protein
MKPTQTNTSKTPSQPIAGYSDSLLSSQATQEAEMEGQKVHENPMSTEKNLGMVAHACHPKFSERTKIGGSWGKNRTLSPKRVPA